VYVVDVRSGERELVVQKTQGSARLSPDAKYVTWYDNRQQAWFARRVEGGQAVNLTRSIPHPLYQEDHDEPYPASPYGSAGWTVGDRSFLVYDRHDLWATDPTGRQPARNVTDGLGRRENMRLRMVRLDPEQDAVDPNAPLVLSAFHWDTKRSGFYRDRVTGQSSPESLVFTERRFGTPIKAKNAAVVAFTRQSVAEFPDLWVSDLTFANARRVTDANPQQAEYRWATVELMEWTSAEGMPLQGLLYKPDDFNSSRKYPLLVNFYDRDSDNRYTHFAPVPHRSVVRPIFYASRGYVVFMPDVVYETGWPGESALNAVVSGVTHLVDRGFIDEANIGVQGHSWGGYQIAYMVTRTDMFKAAAAGAPVANMTSAYGGIRWETGLSRMFQYERTQSRIGASLWEAPMRYIDNSPLFRVDEVNTPVLIMHNDGDGHVPWYQGIELFVALRRLGKPAWLVNYNGERHWPLAFAERRDWNIRMQQFFDHYLKGAPAPVWLAEGVPATEKGRTLGLEVK
jgi:dienelactone hydrolase